MMDAPSDLVKPRAVDDPCRVMIVEDSGVMRRFIAHLFKGNADIEIAASVDNGQRALDVFRVTPVDVIILDIEMPVMDGLTAIPLLKGLDSAVQIIMASSLTQRNAEISLRALRLGATDTIPKPGSVSGSSTLFREELVAKVRELTKIARRKGVRGTSLANRSTYSASNAELARSKVPALRSGPKFKPAVLAIGSSTGGPEALIKVIRDLGEIPQPVVITQHMPPIFTSFLAADIATRCHVKCTEAQNDAALIPGHYYVAPGDYHLVIVQKPGGHFLRLHQEARENFCRPSVDPMLRSLTAVFGSRVLSIILTGMGRDGYAGSEAVVAAGGSVIAQDEASSVVWGMPGAVAAGGLCSAILPIDEVGKLARRYATGSPL